MIAALFILLAIAAGCFGLVGYCYGVNRKVRDSDAHRRGEATGYRKGRMEGEDERDQLSDELDRATAEYVATLNQLVGIAQERDKYKDAVEEMNVVIARMGADLTRRRGAVDVDAEDALELRTGHRDHELAAEVSVDQWFADVRPIVGDDHDHEVSP